MWGLLFTEMLCCTWLYRSFIEFFKKKNPSTQVFLKKIDFTEYFRGEVWHRNLSHVQWNHDITLLKRSFYHFNTGFFSPSNKYYAFFKRVVLTFYKNSTFSPLSNVGHLCIHSFNMYLLNVWYSAVQRNLQQWWKYSITIGNTLATSHIWLLNTWNVLRKTKELNFKLYLI